MRRYTEHGHFLRFFLPLRFAKNAKEKPLFFACFAVQNCRFSKPQFVIARGIDPPTVAETDCRKLFRYNAFS